MSETVSWRPPAAEIPTSPGVYRFIDAAGRVIYVGKATALRSRLSNYFQPLRSLHERTRRMVLTAASVEWTVVGSEFEALQLEYTWIKEFNPPFNVKFRDDKTYPYLAITLGETVPRVLITRNKNLKDARYFGPYTKAWAIRETVDLMLKAFPMRSCTDTTYKRAEQTGRPCLLGDIGKCAAPCVGRVSKEDHKSIALDFASFMGGNDSRYTGELDKRMQQASAAQDYEGAARYRDQLSALQNALAKTSIVLSDEVDADIFGIAHDELAAAVQLFIVRGGRVRGVRGWVVDKELDVELGDLVEIAVQNAYDDSSETGTGPPREIIVPALPDDVAELEKFLGGLREKGKVSVKLAQRGDKAALAATVTHNAQNSLVLYKTRRSGDFTARSQALSDIQDALGMEGAPLRMECYDVSHLSGTNIVASMVVFEDGLARKDEYRRFAIAESTDDTESIYQVLTRRLAYLKDPVELPQRVEPPQQVELVETPARKKFHYPPQLLIVDGGQPQVAAAKRALDESGVTGIQLCGIAKRLEEIWLPDSDYPVILPRNSDALFLFQRIRDEAHRFAISYQRQKRSADVATVLADIPGLGPARVQALLKHFGSVARLRAADASAIGAVRGIGPALATAVVDALRSEK